MLEIKKIYFMFHPVCWANSGTKPPKGRNAVLWRECLNWEKSVNQKQKDFMLNMKDNEVLVIFPIGKSRAMKDLVRHAGRVLNQRCIIVDKNPEPPLPSWQTLANPIESFLNDDNFPGRSRFLKVLPKEIQAEVVKEISDACQTLGYNWNIAALKVIVGNRLFALCIQNELKRRGLYFDPATVESEAFGEGFEECAMTWKSMLGHYLGFAKPVENNFDLSVSGQTLLFKSKLIERIELQNGIRLFIWEREDGRLIALFSRVECRLKDPQYFVRMPMDGVSMEVWDVENKQWPRNDSILMVDEGGLNLPVYNSIRRDAADFPAYMLMDGISVEEARGRLVNAEIYTSNKNETTYSLFGDPKKGYKRFLYDAYLPSDHSEQGVSLVLSPGKMRDLCGKIQELESKIANKLNEYFDGQIWPVDRWLIHLTAHCYLNVQERIKCLLQSIPPEELRFTPSFTPQRIEPALTVKEFLSRTTGSARFFEQMLITLFNHHKIEVEYKPVPHKKVSFNAKKWLESKLRHLKYTYNYGRSLIKYRLKYKGLKPKLLVLNRLLDADEFKACEFFADLYSLDSWVNRREEILPRKMLRKRLNRMRLEQVLNDLKLDEEDVLFKQVIPVIVKNYPVSLIEGRAYLEAQANKLLKKLSRNRAVPLILSVDHGLWKREVYSALASVVAKNGGLVISTSHGSPDGFVDYAATRTLDQCLNTHYLSHFKEPFVQVAEISPQVFQVNLMKKFSGDPPRNHEKDNLKIYYFPHWQMIPPSFNFWFNGIEHPEDYFDNQKNIFLALDMIAGHPRVSEVVIKLRPNMSKRAKQKYFALIEQILGADKSEKFQVVADLSTSQVLPRVSIAVHDMFSSGFVETMWAGIPSFVVFSNVTEVPSRVPDREYWMESGIFVRSAEDLSKNLLAWIEGSSPRNYVQMRERFLTTCGWGSPSAGETLKTIVKGAVNNQYKG